METRLRARKLFFDYQRRASYPATPWTIKLTRQLPRVPAGPATRNPIISQRAADILGRLQGRCALDRPPVPQARTGREEGGDQAARNRARAPRPSRRPIATRASRHRGAR